MKFIINYSDTSFRRYMSRRSVNPFITKTEKIVSFLAILELVKQKIVWVEQDELFKDIILKKAGG